MGIKKNTVAPLENKEVRSMNIHGANFFIFLTQSDRLE